MFIKFSTYSNDYHIRNFIKYNMGMKTYSI